ADYAPTKWRGCTDTHDLWQRQQRLVLRSHVLVGDVQHDSRRRIVTHQGHDVDESLVPEQSLRAGEGVGTHFVFADCIATELHDDRVLFRQLRQRPAELDGVDDLLLQPRLLRGRLVRGPYVLAVHFARR